MTYPWSGQHQRLMSSTPGEFVASLKTAFPAALTAGEGWAELGQDDIRLRFEFAVGRPRRLGCLELPTMQLSIHVLAGDPVAASAFLDRVDRATQRGGG